MNCRPLRSGAGVAFKPQHFDALLADPQRVDFFEIHAENYFGAGVNYYYKRDNKQALKYLEKVVPMYQKNQSLDYLGDAYAYLYKINIEEAIFTEEHCEFKKEDYDNPVFDEKLLFLNIIYSKIENRTKEILGII